jgi:hypothetical protein
LSISDHRFQIPIADCLAKITDYKYNIHVNVKLDEKCNMADGQTPELYAGTTSCMTGYHKIYFFFK